MSQANEIRQSEREEKGGKSKLMIISRIFLHFRLNILLDQYYDSQKVEYIFVKGSHNLP